MDQSEAELQSNQSDYSMTSWVMTSTPETKHPSHSSLCSFLWNKFKDTERKHSVLAVLTSVWPILWPETHYLGVLHHDQQKRGRIVTMSHLFYIEFLLYRVYIFGKMVYRTKIILQVFCLISSKKTNVNNNFKLRKISVSRHIMLVFREYEPQ